MPLSSTTLAMLSTRALLPLAEVELPWNPDLTQFTPMQLFLGTLAVAFLVLVVLYFYSGNASTEN